MSWREGFPSDVGEDAEVEELPSGGSDPFDPSCRRSNKRGREGGEEGEGEGGGEGPSAGKEEMR